MGYVQERSKELKETKRQLAHKAKYSTRQEMSVREQKAKLHDLKAQFLTHNKLGPFVNKIFDIAMDDDHKDQMSAVRLIADRVLPNQSFAHTSKGSNAVQINISGLNVEVKEKEVNQSEDDLEDIEGEVIDG
jgi:lysyl-tRNA synthetase class II